MRGSTYFGKIVCLQFCFNLGQILVQSTAVSLDYMIVCAYRYTCLYMCVRAWGLFARACTCMRIREYFRASCKQETYICSDGQRMGEKRRVWWSQSATVYRALGNGRAGVLKYLLETQERRELLGVADLYDRTPAHDAAENGHVECLQLLVETGVSLYLPDKVLLSRH